VQNYYIGRTKGVRPIKKVIFFDSPRVRDWKGYGMCATMRNLWTLAKPDLVETHMQGRKSTLFWICCGFSSPHKLTICGGPKVLEGNFV